MELLFFLAAGIYIVLHWQIAIFLISIIGLVYLAILAILFLLEIVKGTFNKTPIKRELDCNVPIGFKKDFVIDRYGKKVEFIYEYPTNEKTTSRDLF